jgi:hypothetical protein
VRPYNRVDIHTHKEAQGKRKTKGDDSSIHLQYVETKQEWSYVQGLLLIY